MLREQGKYTSGKIKYSKRFAFIGKLSLKNQSLNAVIIQHKVSTDNHFHSNYSDESCSDHGMDQILIGTNIFEVALADLSSS